MLEELRELKYQGGKDALLFFISDVVGENIVNIKDAQIMCAHAPGKYYFSVDDLCDYCTFWGWICRENDLLKVSDSLLDCIKNKDALNTFLIRNTVNQLFDSGIYHVNMFTYDAVRYQYSFKNELLPLALSTVRNTLISQGFISVSRNPQGTRFYVNPCYEDIIARHCKNERKKLSLENLKKQLEENALAGEKAELFVLNYERKRLGTPLCDNVKRISEIDVTAGYDIVSFESPDSEASTRYIEVKAVSDTGFYWSKSEYEIAKLLGERYCIYLVSLAHIDEEEYEPNIIINPAYTIMENEDWLVEPQSYHIKKLV